MWGGGYIRQILRDNGKRETVHPVHKCLSHVIIIIAYSPPVSSSYSCSNKINEPRQDERCCKGDARRVNEK